MMANTAAATPVKMPSMQEQLSKTAQHTEKIDVKQNAYRRITSIISRS
jgi:hypothetical protein